MSEKRIIHTGRDYFEEVSGDAQLTTGSSIHGDYAQLLLNSITANSSQQDLINLLAFVKKELVKLDIPESVKKELLNEIAGAEMQAQKDPPEKRKLLERLRNASTTLRSLQGLGKEVITIGNLIGKAIEWGGDKWTEWTT